jgi:hypothetical protein
MYNKKRPQYLTHRVGIPVPLCAQNTITSRCMSLYGHKNCTDIEEKRGKELSLVSTGSWRIGVVSERQTGTYLRMGTMGHRHSSRMRLDLYTR